MAALRATPERYPFLEQSALNELIAGGFAPLSPRYNFMGDFFLLDLEKIVDPIVLHFVNSPKPWDIDEWRGEARFAQSYQAWFEASPWPEYLTRAPMENARRMAPRKTSGRRAFADRLIEFLKTCAFADGWRLKTRPRGRSYAMNAKGHMSFQAVWRWRPSGCDFWNPAHPRLCAIAYHF